jgi:hypothetical protein
MRWAGALTLSSLAVLILVLAAPALAKSKGSASGEIKSIDGRSLVLQVKKDEHHFTLTKETQYRRANEKLTAGHFKVGDRVRVKYKVVEATDGATQDQTGDAEKIALRVELWIPPQQVRRGGV